MAGYYLKYNDRVSGPFPVDTLKTMANDGLVTNLHQISGDREHWIPFDQLELGDLSGKGPPAGGNDSTASHNNDTAKVLLRDDGLIEYSGGYNTAFRVLQETMTGLGGTIKANDPVGGFTEAAWAYSITFWGIRVMGPFRKAENGALQIKLAAGFKDAIDTMGVAKKKREEVAQAFVAC